MKAKGWLGWGLRLAALVAISAGLVGLLCWRFGWHGRQGVSDALFVVGLAEIIIAGGSVWGSPTETSGSLVNRVWANMRDKPGSTEHQQTILADMVQKQTTAAQALLVGLLTMAAAVALTL